MLDKRFEIKHEHEDMLTIGVDLLQAWSIMQQKDMDIGAKTLHIQTWSQG